MRIFYMWRQWLWNGELSSVLTAFPRGNEKGDVPKTRSKFNLCPRFSAAALVDLQRSCIMPKWSAIINIMWKHDASSTMVPLSWDSWNSFADISSNISAFELHTIRTTVMADSTISEPSTGVESKRGEPTIAEDGLLALTRDDFKSGPPLSPTPSTSPAFSISTTRSKSTDPSIPWSRSIPIAFPMRAIKRSISATSRRSAWIIFFPQSTRTTSTIPVSMTAGANSPRFRSSNMIEWYSWIATCWYWKIWTNWWISSWILRLVMDQAREYLRPAMLVAAIRWKRLTIPRTGKLRFFWTASARQFPRRTLRYKKLIHQPGSLKTVPSPLSTLTQMQLKNRVLLQQQAWECPMVDFKSWTLPRFYMNQFLTAWKPHLQSRTMNLLISHCFRTCSWADGSPCRISIMHWRRCAGRMCMTLFGGTKRWRTFTTSWVPSLGMSSQAKELMRLMHGGGLRIWNGELRKNKRISRMVSEPKQRRDLLACSSWRPFLDYIWLLDHVRS